MLKQEEDDAAQQGANIMLNATSEFCRALGEIPTYGQSGNRDEMEKDELQVMPLINYNVGITGLLL